MSVAIVNHNTCRELRECLATIPWQDAAQVVVVDNASSDGTVEMLGEHYPGVILHRNDINVGYGAAANQAVSLCSSNYVLLLNSDTRLEPNAILALNSSLDVNPRAAVVGPRLHNPDGSLQPSSFPFPTIVDILLDVSHCTRLIRRIPWMHEYYLRTWSHRHPRQVPWVLGAAMAIRRKAFDEVGGFDESFLLYYEEVDLCFRLAEAGWETQFAPVTNVIHTTGASTSQRRSDMSVQFYASLVHFYRRHYSRFHFIALVILLEVIALVRWIRDLIALGLTRNPIERARLADTNAAWQRLFLGEWRRQTLGD